MQETQVWSLGWNNPLEKEMAIHSRILTWRIPWMEEPGGLQFMGRAGNNWATNTFTTTSYFIVIDTCIHTATFFFGIKLTLKMNENDA